jgi:hypothetical protein
MSSRWKVYKMNWKMMKCKNKKTAQIVNIIIHLSKIETLIDQII